GNASWIGSLWTSRWLDTRPADRPPSLLPTTTPATPWPAPLLAAVVNPGTPVAPRGRQPAGRDAFHRFFRSFLTHELPSGRSRNPHAPASAVPCGLVGRGPRSPAGWRDSGSAPRYLTNSATQRALARKSGQK